VAPEGIALDDEIGDLRLVVHNIDRFVDSFAHLFVFRVVRDHVRSLQLGKQRRNQVRHCRKRHVLHCIPLQVRVFVDIHVHLGLEVAQSLHD